MDNNTTARDLNSIDYDELRLEQKPIEMIDIDDEFISIVKKEANVNEIKARYIISKMLASKPKTDLQKLKSVFDDIGVKYDEDVDLAESPEKCIPVKYTEMSRNINVKDVEFKFVSGKLQRIVNYGL